MAAIAQAQTAPAGVDAASTPASADVVVSPTPAPSKPVTTSVKEKAAEAATDHRQADAVAGAKGFGAVDDVFVGFEPGHYKAAKPATLYLRFALDCCSVHDASWNTG